ncbi:MAG: F420-dependent methylenetetrahydromethanopterin dehydrogenase [Candidatus Odinarchaeia archaeon]
MVDIGVLKAGNIGVAPLLEFLFDERAEREDVNFTVMGTGSKLSADRLRELGLKMLDFNPQLILIVCPNASLPVYKELITLLSQKPIPVVIISDKPGKKIIEKIENLPNFGYIIITGDPIIGARKEFLDPVEMAIFNSDIIKILAVSGVLSVIYRTIDKLIDAIKKKETFELPKVIVTGDLAVEEAGFVNPYAKCKALAAYLIAEKVATVNFEGCFKIKDWKKYTSVVATGHEMIRIAAKLADEAREMEKSGDNVTRRPHDSEGNILEKRKLISKP